jgi:hypothetical protein
MKTNQMFTYVIKAQIGAKTVQIICQASSYEEAVTKVKEIKPADSYSLIGAHAVTMDQGAIYSMRFDKDADNFVSLSANSETGAYDLASRISNMPKDKFYIENLNVYPPESKGHKYEFSLVCTGQNNKEINVYMTANSEKEIESILAPLLITKSIDIKTVTEIVRD